MRIPKLDFPIKLELGGKGSDLGIDIKDYGQEIVWDLRNGIPLPDKSVTEVYSSHFLEHLDNSEITELIREIHRVLEQGGIFESKLPHSDSLAAFYPNHNSFWNEERVKAMCRDTQQGENLFDVVEIKVGDELYFKLRKS